MLLANDLLKNLDPSLEVICLIHWMEIKGWHQDLNSVLQHQSFSNPYGPTYFGPLYISAFHSMLNPLSGVQASAQNSVCSLSSIPLHPVFCMHICDCMFKGPLWLQSLTLNTVFFTATDDWLLTSAFQPVEVARGQQWDKFDPRHYPTCSDVWLCTDVIRMCMCT